MNSSEILIIGGGIVGTSTAYHLAQYGHQVTLLEQGELASEASGLNAGTIWATGWGHMPNLLSTLSMGSLEIFKTLQLDMGYDIEFRQSGSLQAIQTEEQYAFAQEELRRMVARGHQVELLTGRDARSIEPELSPSILGCLYSPHGGNANPVKTVLTLASLAQKHGATILTQREVTGIARLDDGTYQVLAQVGFRGGSPEKEGYAGDHKDPHHTSPYPHPYGDDEHSPKNLPVRAYKVATSPDTFKTSTLVLAAGPWCRSLGAMLGLHIPVFAVRGQMWATAPMPPRIFHSIGALESHLYWHNHPFCDEQTPLELTHHDSQRLTRHLYGRQTRDGEIIIGGDRQLNAPKTLDQAGIEINRSHAIELFPFLQDLPIARTWAGWMPFTRDLHPLIGKIPHFENLYLLTGLSSSGFEKGSMSGKLLADCIHDGVAAPILAEADPAREVTELPQYPTKSSSV